VIGGGGGRPVDIKEAFKKHLNSSFGCTDSLVTVREQFVLRLDAHAESYLEQTNRSNFLLATNTAFVAIILSSNMLSKTAIFVLPLLFFFLSIFLLIWNITFPKIGRTGIEKDWLFGNTELQSKSDLECDLIETYAGVVFENTKMLRARDKRIRNATLISGFALISLLSFIGLAASFRVL
jgi:hypothetical protein